MRYAGSLCSLFLVRITPLLREVHPFPVIILACQSGAFFVSPGALRPAIRRSVGSDFRAPSRLKIRMSFRQWEHLLRMEKARLEAPSAEEAGRFKSKTCHRFGRNLPGPSFYVEKRKLAGG